MAGEAHVMFFCLLGSFAQNMINNVFVSPCCPALDLLKCDIIHVVSVPSTVPAV